MKKLFLLVTLVILTLFSVFVYAWTTEFPSIKIQKGWNLVYGFSDPEQLDGQALSKSSIKAIYVFVPITQQYARVYPNPEYDKLGMMDEDEQLFHAAYWVYSDKESETEYWLQNEPMPLNKKRLYKGWNFVGVSWEITAATNPSSSDMRINDIKGNCEIEKAYYWHIDDKGWIKLSNSDPLPQKLFGYGLLVKAANNCMLGSPKTEVPQVPEIPN